MSGPSNVDQNERDGEYYKRKYERLRKTVIEIVHQNGALCKEVDKTEEKVSNVKAERKYLLKKLMQYEKPNLNRLRPSSKKSDNNTKSKKRATKAKKGQISRSKSDGNAASSSSICSIKTESILVKPIQVDSNGRPIFPIEIGDLSVYSIGEIVHDRAKYHDSKFIFPVGYCSTRLFTKISSPEQQCLYTCKILDGGPTPRFEISPEDAPEKDFSARSISEAYNSFLRAVTDTPQNMENSSLNAYEFFGLSQPTVQNLIQSLPGACKCIGYDWKKIEVIHPNNGDSRSKSGKGRVRQSDINIEALEKWARDT